MDDIDTLAEIEQLKQLKARYCRLLDTKQWDQWRALFTDDFVSDTSRSGGKIVEGGDEFVAFLRRILGKPSQTTVHQVHAPELELTSATSARGVWALHDIVRFAPGVKLQAYGHYHETYEKVGGAWLLKTSVLTRVREDLMTPLGTFQLTERLKSRLQRLAPKVGP